MKELILQALKDTMNQVERQTPITKTHTIEIDIEDVKPKDLLLFMDKNNIPDNAVFSVTDNEGNFSYPKTVLSYDTQIPTTKDDHIKFKIKRFNSAAFKFVSDLLTVNGYKRKGFSSGLLREFEDTTVYEMYIKADIDRLVKYYSLYFTIVY